MKAFIVSIITEVLFRLARGFLGQLEKNAKRMEENEKVDNQAKKVMESAKRTKQVLLDMDQKEADTGKGPRDEQIQELRNESRKLIHSLFRNV